MKLEIDIPSIIYNDAKENRGYISVGKMEIAWKAIADGKPLEQETVSKEVYDHEYFLRKELELKIDKLQRQFEKIRTEIQELPIQFTCAHEMRKWALKIIDKYKAESRDKG